MFDCISNILEYDFSDTFSSFVIFLINLLYPYINRKYLILLHISRIECYFGFQYIAISEISVPFIKYHKTIRNMHMCISIA